MKKYFIFLLLLLIPFGVKAEASQGYNVYINNDDIQVKSGNEEILDYSNIVEYSNRVLTVKEGAYIYEIQYNDIDLTVTSNNKIAYIGSINHGSYQTNLNVHKTLTIRDYKNDENTPWRLYVNVEYSKIVANNCEIYNLYSLSNNEYWKNVEAGLTAKDCTFIGGILFTAGPIILENINYEGPYIQSEDSYLIIKKSNLNMHGNLYNDGGDGYIEIYDSTINFVEDYGQISVYNWEDIHEKDYSLIIKNTTINGGGMYTSTTHDLPVYIEKVNMTTNINEIGGSIYIKDSNIKMNFKDNSYGTNLHGMSIINSTVETNNRLQNNEGINTVIKDSVLKVGHKYSDYNETTIDYSSIESAIMALYENTTVNNSSVTVIRPKGLSDYYQVVLRTRKKLLLNKSYLYIENKDDDIITFEILDEEGKFKYDEGLVVTDNNSTELKLVHSDDYSSYYYDEEGNNISKIVTLRSTANVTFKIENGAWANGSMSDVVITKGVWTKLDNEDIPELPEQPTGHWEIVPSTSEFIKGDVTYVYVLDKEIKRVEENPKTGVSNIPTIIGFAVVLALSIIYYKTTKKSFIRRG